MKMKRCFSTLACIGSTFDEVIAYAKNAGISAVEVRLDKQNSICGCGIADADIIKNKLAESCIAISDLATGVSLSDYSEAVIENGRACIDLAQAVGCRAIRIFVGGHMKSFTDTPKQSFDGIVKAVAELCEYAARKDVEVWAETHSSMSTAKSVCELCDAVGADNLKVLWDVLHSIEFHEAPAESVRIMGKRLAHVHLKDARPPEDANNTQYIHTALGKGTFPIGEVLRLLDEAGYDGYLSLEWELPWRPELAGCYADTAETLAAYNAWLDEAMS